jgi:putative ABC transport system permease protein
MRTPLAWNNVVHNKLRTAASLSGVTFAIVLVFMQLGFYDVCFRSATMIYDLLDFDLALVSVQYVHMRSTNAIPRRRLYQAKQVAGVASAAPLYIVNAIYRNPIIRSQREMLVLGVNPADQPFLDQQLKDSISLLKKDDTAILDQKTSKGYDRVGPGTIAELENRRIEVVGTYEHGSGFMSDASLIVSDRTLSKVFDHYPLELVSVGLIKLEPGADETQVVRALEAMLPEDVRVRKRSDVEAYEQRFWMQVRPMGIMFASGVLLAFGVGAVILYQVLASDVLSRLKEYATLKAMGYSGLFMSAVVLEQAAIFAVLGYFPATITALVLYKTSSAITNLPMIMTWTRIIFVLALSVVMCCLSAFLVTRKVVRADPADLF